MRYLTRAALAASTALVALGLLAGPAAAHQVTASGSADCAESGEYVVTWTLHNSEQGKRMVYSAEVSDNLGAFGSVVPAPQGTATQTTSVPGDFSGTVSLSVIADWYDGNGDATTHHVGPKYATATVELGGDCAPPPTTPPTEPPVTTPPTTPAAPPTVPAAPPTTAKATPPSPPAECVEGSTSPDCLPFTGSESRVPLYVGGGAFLVGLALVGGARARRA